MGFFNQGREEDPGTEPVNAQGVPTAAEQRLAEIAGGEFFTSTLSVEEFALLSLLGPTPVAQVMGASVHRVGWQYLPPSAQWGGEVYCPLSTVMEAWDDARRLALMRLREEAWTVQSNAVVGVTLKRGDHDWARGTVDYVVSGTAIRDPRLSSASGSPVLSDLSVQDYWKLACAGWAPAGLVAATSVFFIAQSTATKWRRRVRVASNQELTEYSRGFSKARETAIEMLRGQAEGVSADGVVGVQFDHDVSRAKLDVAKVYGYGTSYQYQQAGYRSSSASSTSLVLGGQAGNQGRDSRSGIVVTIQAVGTAIRRQQSLEIPAPGAVMRMGMAV